MRRIDVDLLADFIAEHEDTFAYAIEHKDREMLEKVLSSIPVAYDINKVIEELKNQSFIDNELNKVVDLDEAIEVIKAGREND